MRFVVLPDIMRNATENIEIYRSKSRFALREMSEILNWIGKFYDRHDVLICFCMNGDVINDLVGIHIMATIC